MRCSEPGHHALVARAASRGLGCWLYVTPMSRMERLINHVMQRYLVPLLLLPAVLSGLSCAAILELPEALRSASRSDQIIAVVFSLFGIIGTIGTFVFVRIVRRKAPNWRFFGLGRTAWSVLINFAWFAGLAGGALMFYDK